LPVKAPPAKQKNADKAPKSADDLSGKKTQPPKTSVAEVPAPPNLLTFFDNHVADEPLPFEAEACTSRSDFPTKCSIATAISNIRTQFAHNQFERALQGMTVFEAQLAKANLSPTFTSIAHMEALYHRSEYYAQNANLTGALIDAEKILQVAKGLNTTTEAKAEMKEHYLQLKYAIPGIQSFNFSLFSKESHLKFAYVNCISKALTADDTQKATQLLQEAFDIFPDNSIFYRLLIKSLSKPETYINPYAISLALREIEPATELDLACRYFTLGNFAKAHEYFASITKQLTEPQNQGLEKTSQRIATKLVARAIAEIAKKTPSLPVADFDPIKIFDATSTPKFWIGEINGQQRLINLFIKIDETGAIKFTQDTYPLDNLQNFGFNAAEFSKLKSLERNTYLNAIKERFETKHRNAAFIATATISGVLALAGTGYYTNSINKQRYEFYKQLFDDLLGDICECSFQFSPPTSYRFTSITLTPKTEITAIKFKGRARHSTGTLSLNTYELAHRLQPLLSTFFGEENAKITINNNQIQIKLNLKRELFKQCNDALKKQFDNRTASFRANLEKEIKNLVFWQKSEFTRLQQTTVSIQQTHQDFDQSNLLYLQNCEEITTLTKLIPKPLIALESELYALQIQRKENAALVVQNFVTLETMPSFKISSTESTFIPAAAKEFFQAYATFTVNWKNLQQKDCELAAKIQLLREKRADYQVQQAATAARAITETKIADTAAGPATPTPKSQKEAETERPGWFGNFFCLAQTPKMEYPSTPAQQTPPPSQSAAAGSAQSLQRHQQPTETAPSLYSSAKISTLKEIYALRNAIIESINTRNAFSKNLLINHLVSLFNKLQEWDNRLLNLAIEIDMHKPDLTEQNLVELAQIFVEQLTSSLTAILEKNRDTKSILLLLSDFKQIKTDIEKILTIIETNAVYKTLLTSRSDDRPSEGSYNLFS
jgi:hypothetical protein